jgi:twinkle protein
VKFRSLDSKSFKQVSKNTDNWKSSFIGWQTLEEKPREIVIVEGEIDQLSYFQIEFGDIGEKLNVLSVPSGAPNPGANFSTYFDFMDDHALKFFNKVSRVILSVDDDAPGINLRNELARRIGREKCSTVVYPKGCKDPNEVLMKHGDVALYNAYKSALPFPVDGIVKIETERSAMDTYRSEGFKRGLLSGDPDIDKHFSHHKKHLITITGNAGSGKTTWVDDHLSKLIENNPNEHLHVAYYSPENRPAPRAAGKIMEKYMGRMLSEDHFNAMSDEQYEKAVRWVNDKYTFMYPKSRGRMELYGERYSKLNALDSILALAKVCVQQYGANILVIDAWNKMEHDVKSGETETNYVSRALDKILEFNDLNDVTTYLVAHPNKQRKSSIPGNYEAPNLGDISGSNNFQNKTDVGIVVHRDKFVLGDDAEPSFNHDAHTSVMFQKIKFAEIGEEGYVKKFMDIHGGGKFVSSINDRTPWQPNRRRVGKTQMALGMDIPVMETNPLKPNTNFGNEIDDAPF